VRCIYFNFFLCLLHEAKISFYIFNFNREDGQVIGAYLNIGDITWSDYGTYICIISNTGDQKITMETQLLGILITITITIGEILGSIRK
jgi:hypothetical protein